MSLVNASKINRRYIEFDIARGVAIVLMILQHSWLLIFSGLANSPFLDSTAFILGTVLVAPVFLFLMGANVINSHRSDSRYLLIRGLKLIVLGYGLSALRFFLPIILGQYLGVFNNLEKIVYGWQPIEYLLEVDILQAAGFSLLVIALLKWRQVKYDYYLLIAFLAAFISPFLWQLNLLGPLKYLAAPFWGSEAYVLFPLFSWIFYPLVGVYFGNLLSKAADKNELYKDCLVKIWPVFLLGIAFVFLDSSSSILSYYHHGIGANLIFASIVICWLAIIRFNYQKISAKVINILTGWSKNVTLIYIIQWLVIAWTALILSIR